MILAGIDMGIEMTKAVIMNGSEVIGRAKISSGGIDRPEQAQKVYEEALASAGINAEDVEAVGATGKGKYDIPYANRRVTETIAAAHAAKLLCPEATSVMSVGADETLIATKSGKRPVGEYVLNQKCAAGLGTFLTLIASRLEMPVEALSDIDMTDAPRINETCPVFMELDALSLLNNGYTPAQVAAACVRAAAVRAAAAPHDLTIPAERCVLLIGGLAKNKAFVKALEEILGYQFVIPAEAEYAGAIGAAISAEKGIDV